MKTKKIDECYSWVILSLTIKFKENGFKPLETRPEYIEISPKKLSKCCGYTEKGIDKNVKRFIKEFMYILKGNVIVTKTKNGNYRFWEMRNG